MPKISSYNLHPQSICGEDGSRVSNVLNTVYENKEFATGIVTDFNVAVGQSMFVKVPIAKYVSIRTDGAISVKFNATTNDSISIAANTSFNVDTLEVINIFITAASNANVKIFIT